MVINDKADKKVTYHSYNCYRDTVQTPVAGLNQPSGNDH